MSHKKRKKKKRIMPLFLCVCNDLHKKVMGNQCVATVFMDSEDCQYQCLEKAMTLFDDSLEHDTYDNVYMSLRHMH